MKTFALYALLVAGQSADIGTTCVGLRSGRFTEANPLLPRSCAGIAAVKTTNTLASMIVFHRIRKHHPKWAVAIMVVPGVMGFAAAGVNVHVMLGK